MRARHQSPSLPAVESPCRMPRPMRPLAAAVLLFAACSGGGSAVAPVGPAPGGVRAAGPRTSSSGEALCAELLLVANFFAKSPLHPEYALRDSVLGKRLGQLALDHLASTGLGAGCGPELAGSQRIRRLALLPDAKPDLNQNGRNWDDVLLAERARITAEAGAEPLPDAWQAFLPWRHATTMLSGPLAANAPSQPATWRTQPDAAARSIALADAASAMTARALAAGHLLLTGRGRFAGASAEEGRLGLELLHQLLAAEETLIGRLFTSGGELGALDDPANYDPVNGARWLPAEVIVDLDGELPSAPSGYRNLDVSSDLLALARLLRASAELAWLAGDGNPHPNLHVLFRGRPFSEAPPAPPSGILSWDEHIGPLLLNRCGSCHTGVGEGGLLVGTYQQMLQGGTRTRLFNLPMVVPGNHAMSMLWRAVTTPPFPFRQMPLGAPLPQTEVQRIAQWIDQGGHEHPVVLPPPPRPGEVLARVLFANLMALHFDRATGALHHRFEVNRGSGVATANATGAALEALAVLARAQPALQYAGLRAADVLAQAATFAGASLCDTEGRAREDLAIESQMPGRTAAVAGQAALTSGMLAAVPFSGGAVGTTARVMIARLLDSYWQPALGTFRQAEGHDGARFEPEVLADLLAALRRAGAMNLPGAGDALGTMLARVYPVLSPAEWGNGGEVLGDGIADTDGNGVPEPAMAGFDHGQLPMFGRALLAGSSEQMPPPADEVTWTRHIRPLFLQRCADCHMNGNQQGSYRLDTLTQLRVAGQSGGVMPMVVPGDPEGSLLYRKLKDRQPPVGEQMPQQVPPLDALALAMVRRWIENGASPR